MNSSVEESVVKNEDNYNDVGETEETTTMGNQYKIKIVCKDPIDPNRTKTLEISADIKVSAEFIFDKGEKKFQPLTDHDKCAMLFALEFAANNYKDFPMRVHIEESNNTNNPNTNTKR